MRRAARQYRHELKYRISPGTAEILRERFRAAMEPDRHAKNGVYRVTSLYFDDIYKSAYYDKTDGIYSRKKFRIRTYDLDPSYIRLEEKCKDGDLGYKKSAVLTLDEFRSIISGNTGFLSDERFSDTAGEDLLWSYSAAGLMPTVVVDYLREPYICEAGNVRITFDSRLMAGREPDMFGGDMPLVPVFGAGEAVLEVKYDNFIPSYIEELLGGLALMRESVSKFVLCGDRLCR